MGDELMGTSTPEERLARRGRELSVPPTPGVVSPSFVDLLREYRLAADALHATWRHKLGISAYEFQALSNLRARPMGIGELGDRLALTSGAMTGLADRLCDTGWIERVVDPRDRRRVQLQMTAKGRGDMAAVEQAWCEAVELEVTQLNPAELEAISNALHVISKLHARLTREEG